MQANDALFVSTENDPCGRDRVEENTVYGIQIPVHVSHWIRERGTGAAIPTAGGQRDSRRVAGPFDTRAAAEDALRQMRCRCVVCGRDGHAALDLGTMGSVCPVNRAAAGGRL